MPPDWNLRLGKIAVVCALAFGAPAIVWPTSASAESQKHYWATSLTGSVDAGVLHGLREAVAHGEVGWLDVVPQAAVPVRAPGINVIFYHAGGNCRIGSDCSRFPASEPTRDQWGDKERAINLNDPQTRKIVIADLVRIVQHADQVAPRDSIVGVHLDNIHKLDAEGLARIFNEYLQAIEIAKVEGLISKTRKTGYIAKNHPEGFRRALDQKLLDTVPLYVVNENATLSHDGTLDRGSRAAQQLGRRYGIPVFLKTFGTDVAYTTDQNGSLVKVYVSQEMTRQMAQLPDIAGAAWSPDEAHYHPTLFVQGSPVTPRDQRPAND